REQAQQAASGQGLTVSEYYLQSELHLPAALVTIDSALLAEVSAGRSLVEGLPKGRGIDVRIRVAAIQTIGRIVRCHLELGLDLLGDLEALRQRRIEVKESRSGQTTVLKRVGAQNVGVRR